MRLLSSILALALSTSAALAGDAGPLAPGAPAGVKQAQMSGDNVLYVLLGVGAIAGMAVALTTGSTSSPAPTGPSNTSIASTV